MNFQALQVESGSASGATSAPMEQQGNKQKPLRFVTNYGAPHPKRRRIGAACLTCRKRKTACSGERPRCETCKQNRQECAGYSSEAAHESHKRTEPDGASRRTSETEKSHRTHNTTPRLDTKPPIQNHALSASIPTYYPPILATQPTQPPQPPQPSQDVSPKHAEDQMRESLLAGHRNRMPYFRWLGPTAIMPGFKQMVVKVKRQDTDNRSSTDGIGGVGIVSPTLGNTILPGDQRLSSMFGVTPASVESDVRTPLSLPFYDTSPMPPSELITHLAQTFFTHLGCNYPFLQRERFLRDLEEKQVDAILVDAVCALAARFSTHTLLTQQLASAENTKTTPAEYGHIYAQRAKMALVDTYACPSVAAVQAALLLAYNEFGESRDSGLWMYLGIAIRMAEDLGMHKLEGLRYQGRSGPTPKNVKREVFGNQILRSVKPDTPTVRNTTEQEQFDDQSLKEIEERKAAEQERVDTFWGIFFLDRVVSSGTGRRSTLRDRDIEISMPSLDQTDAKSGWPAPFPAVIRIVHLYGRVADILNGIDMTAEVPRRLADMELQVTELYQNLSKKLHFDAVNFQHYVKAGEGTNFVLLHLWFHVLIILLHQPTLLKTFEGRMLRLFPNSQRLSMSSAKTIADILSYSQLIDTKASLGNPFTTQPIYIAACAFLKETVEQTATSNAQSRAASPTRASNAKAPQNGEDSANVSTLNDSNTTGAAGKKKDSTAASSSTSSGQQTPTTSITPISAERNALSKHTLLATAASQHYQLCYKALQSIETYWSGTKYILTVLEQKFEGVGDPLLYTVEEGDAAMERPQRDPEFRTPGWRRKVSCQWPGGELGREVWLQAASRAGSEGPVDVGKAIGWTLTGRANSPSTNLAWHFASDPNYHPASAVPDSSLTTAAPMALDPRLRQDDATQRPQDIRAESSSIPGPASVNVRSTMPGAVSHSDANLLLGLGSSYQSGAAQPSSGVMPYDNQHPHSPDRHTTLQAPTPPHRPHSIHSAAYQNPAFMANQGPTLASFPQQTFYGDMLIESQDVDMSLLGLDMPWFDPGFALVNGGAGVVGFEGMFEPGGQAGEDDRERSEAR